MAQNDYHCGAMDADLSQIFAQMKLKDEVKTLFIEQDVTTMEIFMLLNMAYLKDMGLTIGDRISITRKIAELRGSNASSQAIPCVECDGMSLAVGTCHTCTDDMCQHCFDAIHRRGTRQKHVFEIFGRARNPFLAGTPAEKAAMLRGLRMARDVEEKTKAAETEKTKAPEMAEEKTKAPEMAEEKTKALEMAEEKTKAPEIEKTKAPEMAEEKAKAPEMAEEKTKAPEMAEEKTKAPEIEKTKAPEMAEEKTKAPEMAAEKTKAPEMEQTKAPVMAEEKKTTALEKAAVKTKAEAKTTTAPEMAEKEKTTAPEKAAVQKTKAPEMAAVKKTGGKAKAPDKAEVRKVPDKAEVRKAPEKPAVQTTKTVTRTMMATTTTAPASKRRRTATNKKVPLVPGKGGKVKPAAEVARKSKAHENDAGEVSPFPQDVLRTLVFHEDEEPVESSKNAQLAVKDPPAVRSQPVVYERPIFPDAYHEFLRGAMSGDDSYRDMLRARLNALAKPGCSYSDSDSELGPSPEPVMHKGLADDGDHDPEFVELVEPVLGKKSKGTSKGRRKKNRAKKHKNEHNVTPTGPNSGVPQGPLVPSNQNGVPPASVCFGANCCKKGGLVCGKCKIASYCSKDCQRTHWKTHKRVCIPPL